MFRKTVKLGLLCLCGILSQVSMADTSIDYSLEEYSLLFSSNSMCDYIYKTNEEICACLRNKCDFSRALCPAKRRAGLPCTDREECAEADARGCPY